MEYEDNIGENKINEKMIRHFLGVDLYRPRTINCFFIWLNSARLSSAQFIFAHF